ncbi:thiamine/thiamine pyrophosphate ABC transporter permease ThiP [Rhodobacteraceae bacterium]|nr:thiamine/thiamine pyrophosphate ABC transporter permease ThiP [Paracoccaceae bacterium]
MADRAQPIGPGGVAGIAAAVAIPFLILLTTGAIVWVSESGAGLAPSDWAAIRFTLSQAALSALFSVVLAVPVARALARQRFPGRGVLVTLLGAPFLLPVIVAVFGLLAVFGRAGIVNAALSFVGLPEVSIYGLHGVVLAHVFFNLPLATRLILQGWQDIPAERYRLAASLGMTARAVNRHLERPMLWQVLPGAALVIFVLCTTSFAVALILGGGPRATTVELAIYQALRFEFDLTRAAFLSLIQLGMTAALALLAYRLVRNTGFDPGLDRRVMRWDGGKGILPYLDGVLIAAVTVFLLLPILAVVFRGAPEIAGLPSQVWASALRSVVVALVSTVLVTVLALTMALAVVRLGRHGGWVETAGLLAVAASPLVLGTGLFVLIHPWANPEGLALPVTILVNAVVTLPFALRAIVPAYRAVEADFGRLADSLGMTGWVRLRLVVLPRLRRPLGFSAGLAAALSMGDLGVIALFADPDAATLPLQIYRLMGSYRMDEASGAAVLLLGLSFALFWVFDRGARGAEV